MANSDNVVRAGLTPKFKDVDTLLSMLTYVDREPLVLTGTPVDRVTVRYSPPVQEFALERTQVPPYGRCRIRGMESGPSILLVYDGEAVMCGRFWQTNLICDGEMRIRRGSVLFMPADINAEIWAGKEGILYFRGYCGGFL
mmetsp:Transcript_14897/g.25462  ORF Transcript_14897/g.25462 Transcript_14897/m.25462 type:complete len:141 (-) Transcript_14897:563-985(-)